MSAFDVASLPSATFGGLFVEGVEAPKLTKAVEANPQALPSALNAHQGLLLIKGVGYITEELKLLLRLS